MPTVPSPVGNEFEQEGLLGPAVAVSVMRPTAPGQSALLLLDVIDLLDKRHIQYAVLGAFAASYYGVVRASLDADAVISVRAGQEAADLCQSLQRDGLTVEHRRGGIDDPIAAVINIEDHHGNRVDLLMGIRGMAEDLFDRSEKASFMNASLCIIGLEDFIASKMFAGSPKDIQDVIGVLQISRQKIDDALLKKLTAHYGSRCLRSLESLLKKYP